MSRTDLMTQINQMTSEKAEAVATAKKRRSAISILGTRAVSPKSAMSLILLWDDSGSMMGNRTAELKLARTKLLDEFPNVERIEIAFSSDLIRINNFDTDYGRWGSTVLRDSLIAATELAKREISHNNVLIIIASDGMDEGSQSSVADCRSKIEEGKSLGYQYYAIWINGQNSLSSQATALGIPDLDVNNISEGIESLIQGIFGYLQSGKLLLENKKQ
jgi:hypothetical protein